MKKYSVNKYLRSEDPDFVSDFSNNMDSSSPYSIFSTPVTENYLESGEDSDNVSIEDDYDVIKEGEDLRYSMSINKYKNVSINCDNVTPINTLGVLDNIFNNKYSKTLITLKFKNANLSKVIKNAEFMGIDFKHSIGCYKALVIPSSKKFARFKAKNKEYFFKTYIANSSQKKTAGLQVVSKLPEDHCMLFQYKNPQNLSFHMASVKYPIDILFLDDKGYIKKISKNIPPGDCGIYSCSNSSSVIEINGGLSEKLDISVGSSVRIVDGMSSKVLPHYAFKLSSLLDIEKTNISFFKKSKLYKYSLKNALYSDLDINYKISSINSNVNKDLIEELRWGFCKNAKIFIDDSNINLNYLNNFLKEVFSSHNLNDINYKLYLEDKSIYSINKYSMDNIYYLDSKIYKKSIFDIPDKNKDVANIINEDLKRCKKIFNRVLKDLKKNLKAYKKIQENKESIKNSKGQLSESFNRISERYKNGLLKIKQIIDKLDSIKDASKTLELMSALVNSCKQCSISIKDYFDVIDDLDSEEFIQTMEQKTNDAEKIFEDLYNSISSLQEFIYKHILGISIIS